MTLPITPETRVGELLEAFPALEEVLVRMAPAFEKLRNPVLRRTVGKVATLEQAARVGGVGVGELIGKLREAAGQSGGAAAGGTGPAEDAKAWLTGAPLREEIDADAMLEQGVHPVGRVRELGAMLAPGEAILLRSSFRPEPLIDLMRRNGLAVYSSQVAAGRHSTWIGRPPAS